jgi:beta-galactosidase
VELYLNGKPLGKRKPESTEDLIAEWKSYDLWRERAPIPRGTKLRHAPFVWKNVAYEPGILKAVGTKAGTVYEDEKRTAGSAFQVILQPDREEMMAGGRDAVRIVAVVADSKGVMVPSATPWITFQAKGPGRLLGTPVLDAVWGMAAINILSTHDAGDISITASADGLKPGQCRIRSNPSR